MSDEIDDDNDLLIEFQHEITAVRLIDNAFVSSRIRIRADLIAGDAPSGDFELALTKIRFWLDSIVAHAIIFRRTNTDAVAMLIDETGKNRTSNYLMLTPNDPTDDHIAILMQAKLTALSNDVMYFGSVEIKSDNTNGLTFRYIGDCNDVLPDIEDWIGERSYFDQPWWHRDDASTLDVVPQEGADLSVCPSWANKLDFLADIVRGPKEDVLIRPDFKPQVIDGGKKDK